MKAIVAEDAGRLAVRELPEPQLQSPYDARVQVLCASICNSTDTHILHRQLDWVNEYPTILGHEAVGRIVEVGPKVRSFRVGELVSRPYASPPAGSGLYESWGAFAEWGLVTDREAMREDGLPAGRNNQLTVPPDFDPAAATQLVTLRETLAFLLGLGVEAGQSLVIFGAGPVGLSFSILARQLGLSPVIVVGRRAAALERAAAFGRATHVIDNTREDVPETARRLTNGGADWAIEAIGADAVLADALASLSPTGAAAIYGVTVIGDGTSELRKSDRIRPVQFHEADTHTTILDWATRGLIPAREFITHELPLVEAAQGFDLLQRREAFKVLLRMV